MPELTPIDLASGNVAFNFSSYELEVYNSKKIEKILYESDTEGNYWDILCSKRYCTTKLVLKWQIALVNLYYPRDKLLVVTTIANLKTTLLRC